MAPSKPTTTTILSALARLSSSVPRTAAVTTNRHLSSTARLNKWEGRKAPDHTARETDSKGVQHEAVKEGKEDRAKSGSRGAGEESGGAGEKTKEEFPEAPDTIGMQDERGGKISGKK